MLMPRLITSKPQVSTLQAALTCCRACSRLPDLVCPPLPSCRLFEAAAGACADAELPRVLGLTNGAPATGSGETGASRMGLRHEIHAMS